MCSESIIFTEGWSGGAYNLDYSRARAYCACSRCGGGCLGIFTLNYPFFLLSLSLLGETEILSQRAVKVADSIFFLRILC